MNITTKKHIPGVGTMSRARQLDTYSINYTPLAIKFISEVSSFMCS